MRLDPLSLRIWRHGIAFAIAFDAVQLAIRTRMRAPLSTAILPVPPLFRDIALSTPGLAALASVAVLAALLFARGRRPVLFAVVALVANRLLLEAFAALDGVYDETSYHAASALLGWLFGRAYARATGEPRDAPEIDQLSALGAAAMFGATYLNAGTSKLHDSGFSWADGDTIRLLVLAHRPAGVPSWLDAVRTFAGESASAAMALSIGTLIIQLGAFFFPWTRRTRLVWGALFVAFHTGIHLVAGSIFFLQAVFLAILFAAPWPALLGRARFFGPVPGEPEPPLAPGHRRRVLAASAAVVASLAVLLALPIRPRAHPIERLPQAVPASVSQVPRALPTAPALGPLAVGAELADGWILREIVVEPDRVVLTAARADDRVLFDLTDLASAPTGRFDTGDLHISYRQTPLAAEAFSGAGESLARRLTEAAAGRPLSGALRDWMRAAAPP